MALGPTQPPIEWVLETFTRGQVASARLATDLHLVQG